MADAAPGLKPSPRHTALVRVTHWITAACFLALLVSGLAIVVSHPRFYWGETGNVNMPYLFKIPIPASRGSVPTGYNYTLHDQNGWSRALHFQTAWLIVFTGLTYVIAGLTTRHFRDHLVPRRDGLAAAIANHLRLKFHDAPGTYNPVQRLAYLAVIFVLLPLAIWTGLAMSPAFVSAVPAAVTILGGQQTARTIHFFDTIALSLFLLVHVAMLVVAGFRARLRAMITGKERP